MSRLPPAQPARQIALAEPDCDINHVLSYGQSLACGYEGWPALSTAPVLDSLMLGDSVHAVDPHEPDWRPIGREAFHPLVATVQPLRGGALLTRAQVAALAPGEIALGETVLEAAVNGWRRRIDGTPGWHPGARLLASACGVGGRTLEALSKDAPIPLFDRLRACVATAQAVAMAEDQSYGIAALLFLQGEDNNWEVNGGTADRAAYKRLLLGFHRDFVESIARDMAGQTTPPAMFLYQTGGDFAADHMAIPQAQLEVALEQPGCFMAAPVYPVTGKAGHLDANGYRWMGAQFAKVMHRVLTQGLDWQPLHPRRASLVGRRVYVDFHVPAPPLAWGRPFHAHAAIDVPDRGFAAHDADGPVPIQAVGLDGAAAVRIGLARPVRGALRLRYADRAHFGRGALHDSDAALADEAYEFTPGRGHYPSAEIAGLVGRPYPLMNWCVAFDIAVQALQG